MLEQNTKWISVEERLPEDGQHVIYYFDVVGVHTGLYNKFYGHDTFHGSGGWLTEDVTHWMPLPDPPAGE